MSLVIRTEAIIQLFLSIKESGEEDQPYLLICQVCHPHFGAFQNAPGAFQNAPKWG